MNPLKFIAIGMGIVTVGGSLAVGYLIASTVLQYLLQWQYGMMVLSIYFAIIFSGRVISIITKKLRKQNSKLEQKIAEEKLEKEGYSERILTVEELEKITKESIERAEGKL